MIIWSSVALNAVSPHQQTQDSGRELIATKVPKGLSSKFSHLRITSRLVKLKFMVHQLDKASCKDKACKYFFTAFLFQSCVSEQHVPQVKILGGFGDAAAGGKAENKFENAFDGTVEACYIPGTKVNSKARFQIPSTDVSYVRVLNRRDCCG